MTDSAIRAASLTFQFALLALEVALLVVAVRGLADTCVAVYPSVADKFAVCRLLNR